MFRNLFILIAVIALFLIVKGIIRRSSKQTLQNTPIKDMVQCNVCQSYLAKEEAILKNGHVFCSQRHLDDWNNKN